MKNIKWLPVSNFTTGEEVIGKNKDGDLCYGTLDFDNNGAYIIDGLSFFDNVTYCIHKEDLLELKEINDGDTT